MNRHLITAVLLLTSVAMLTCAAPQNRAFGGDDNRQTAPRAFPGAYNNFYPGGYPSPYYGMNPGMYPGGYFGGYPDPYAAVYPGAYYRGYLGGYGNPVGYGYAGGFPGVYYNNQDPTNPTNNGYD